MKKGTLAILITLAAIFVHGYLTLHFYPVKYGSATGDSLCNINATFNCDSVAASDFSTIKFLPSQFLSSLPLSLWGLATHLVLLFLILIPTLKLTEFPEKFIRTSYYLSLFIALTSVIMGALSLLFLSSYCLFCITAYVLSFLNLEVLRRLNKEETSPSTPSPFQFKSTKILPYSLLAVLVISLIAHKSFTSSYEEAIKQSGQGSLESFVHRSLKKWEQAPVFEFSDEDVLILGDPKAPVVLVEFADFLCPHCKKAAPSLHAFTKAHPKEVQLRFYAFPLDGSCNEAIQRKGGGERCVLAKATYCANQKGFGWEMLKHLFDYQSELYSIDAIEAHIQQALAEFYPLLKYEAFKTCIDSEETHDAILRHAKKGAMAQIEGTPTIFVQGKKLEGGQFPPILDAVLKKVLSSNSKEAPSN